MGVLAVSAVVLSLALVTKPKHGWMGQNTRFSYIYRDRRGGVSYILGFVTIVTHPHPV